MYGLKVRAVILLIEQNDSKLFRVTVLRCLAVGLFRPPQVLLAESAHKL